MGYTVHVNGTEHSVECEPDTPLLWVLRDCLGMTGTKFGCGSALCGACTVHVDGAAARACMLRIESLATRRILTIEGIGASEIGAKLQQAWIALDVAQCGYCQGGQILSATALLMRNPHPTDEQIDAAMAGNLCRCATYTRIRAAIRQVAGSLQARA